MKLVEYKIMPRGNKFRIKVWRFLFPIWTDLVKIDFDTYQAASDYLDENHYQRGV